MFEIFFDVGLRPLVEKTYMVSTKFQEITE